MLILFISYPTNLTLSVTDLNPRKIVTICIRIRRYPTVSDPFTSCKTLVLLWVLLLQVSGLVDVMKPNVLVGWHFLAVAYLFWLWLVPWILIGVFTDTIALAIHCLGATTHHQKKLYYVEIHALWMCATWWEQDYLVSCFRVNSLQHPMLAITAVLWKKNDGTSVVSHIVLAIKAVLSFPRFTHPVLVSLWTNETLLLRNLWMGWFYFAI